jgi:hypothetical protein
MAVGLLILEGMVLEASAEFEYGSRVCGDGIGEYDFSENDVVEDAGDVFPPQPKNDPSLEPPGDFGGPLLIVVLESYESLE